MKRNCEEKHCTGEVLIGPGSSWQQQSQPGGSFHTRRQATHNACAAVWQFHHLSHALWRKIVVGRNLSTRKCCTHTHTLYNTALHSPDLSGKHDYGGRVRTDKVKMGKTGWRRGRSKAECWRGGNKNGGSATGNMASSWRGLAQIWQVAMKNIAGTAAGDRMKRGGRGGWTSMWAAGYCTLPGGPTHSRTHTHTHTHTHTAAKDMSAG